MTCNSPAPDNPKEYKRGGRLPSLLISFLLRVRGCDHSIPIYDIASPTLFIRFCLFNPYQFHSAPGALLGLCRKTNMEDKPFIEEAPPSNKLKLIEPIGGGGSLEICG